MGARTERYVIDMKLSKLRRLADHLAGELERKPYGYWLNRDFPFVFERDVHGQRVQVEIVKLEETADHLHLSVALDDGGWSAFCAPGRLFTVLKPPD